MEYAVIYIMKCLCIMNVRRIGIKKMGTGMSSKELY